MKTMKKRLKLLLMLDTFFIVAAGMLGPVYAIYIEQIGGNILDIGYSWALFSIFAGVLTLAMGKIEEHSNKVKMALLGYIIKVHCFLAYIFIVHPYQLFILQIILGISAAITMPAYDSLFSRALDKGKETFQWGLWESSYNISSAVAALVGSFIVYYISFNALFIIMALLAIIGLITFTYSAKKIKKW